MFFCKMTCIQDFTWTSAIHTLPKQFLCCSDAANSTFPTTFLFADVALLVLCAISTLNDAVDYQTGHCCLLISSMHGLLYLCTLHLGIIEELLVLYFLSLDTSFLDAQKTMKCLIRGFFSMNILPQSSKIRTFAKWCTSLASIAMTFGAIPSALPS